MVILIKLAVIVLVIVALWKVFLKAGQSGWASIIPFYNWYILLKVAAKPGWWLILFFIPLVNLVFYFLTCLGVAEKFSKGAGFAVGLFFLPFIFFPILAFSEARYGG